MESILLNGYIVFFTEKETNDRYAYKFNCIRDEFAKEMMQTIVRTYGGSEKVSNIKFKKMDRYWNFEIKKPYYFTVNEDDESVENQESVLY